MTLLDQLIEKHRKRGVLVDTNLLVLLFVGRTNRIRINSFKRTQKYTCDDYDLLELLLSKFSGLLTTPHVLTELSNLATLSGTEFARVRQLMQNEIKIIRELHEASSTIVTNYAFMRLGLADAAIAQLSNSALVLTDDLDLYIHLQNIGIDVLNFNHIRVAAWG